MRPLETAVAWDVFNPEGRYLGSVALPRMRVMHIGGEYIAGATRDRMGVQRVMVVPLVRGHG